jgi:hypothetical protein
MATIADIVKKGSGRAGAWKVINITDNDCIEICTLYHYATPMLRWNRKEPSNSRYLTYSLGWGSISDQSAMNLAFRVLDIPLFYSRVGGAKIVSRELKD